jgi:hypothetical protein
MARRQCHTHTHTHTPCYLEIRLINRIQVGFDLLLGQGVSAVDNLFSCPKIHDKRHKTFFRSSALNEICRFANCVIITECIGCINRIVEFFFVASGLETSSPKKQYRKICYHMTCIDNTICTQFARRCGLWTNMCISLTHWIFLCCCMMSHFVIWFSWGNKYHSICLYEPTSEIWFYICHHIYIYIYVTN